MLDISDLHKYQLNAIEKIKELKKCNLYADPGSGKTIISLTLIKQLYKDGLIHSALIIAPLYIANEVWHNEIAKWKHLTNLTYSIVTGTETQRHKALTVKANIFIINRENLLWLFIHGHRSFDIIIVDESTSFKNSSGTAAKIFQNQKIYHEVKKHFKNCTFLQFKKLQFNKFIALSTMQCKFMVNLTGTPAPNGMEDVYGQIYLLDKGLRLGKNITEYRNRYFYKNYNGFGYSTKNAELIFEKIKDITIRIKNEDYLELPDKLHLTTYVNLNKHQKQYNELKEEFVLELEPETTDKNIESAFNRLIVVHSLCNMSNKLLQFCNGGLYDENGIYNHIHDYKLEALAEIIASFPEENILVAYNYKSDLIRLQKYFKDGVSINTNKNAIEQWNKGKIKLLLCHPANAGKGLNLQHGGRIIVWFGLTWNLEDYMQLNARLYRQGQCKPVIIQHIVAKNCIDGNVMDRLKTKEERQNNFLNYNTSKII